VSDVRVLHGDCVELMRGMPENSVDSIVTDPPYELSFMGRRWDASGIAYSVEMWAEALRVLKPGGHLLAFGGTRTYHRMACAIEDVGFEIRDSIHWVYGSGFPKSLNIGKAIDKAAGAPVKVGKAFKVAGEYGDRELRDPESQGADRDAMRHVPITDEAARWEGWGTALKPAHEPIVVARKPLVGTVAGNVLVWGTGGLNIDGCRVGTDEIKTSGARAANITGDTRSAAAAGMYGPSEGVNTTHTGRWPANVVFDRTAGEALDAQAPSTGSFLKPGKRYEQDDRPAVNTWNNGAHDAFGVDGKGGASRFFTQADFGPDDWPFVYQAKPSRKERNAGLDGLPEKRKVFNGKSDKPGSMKPGSVEDRQTAQPAPNHHPTVKPVALMRHLVRLVTPPGGTVLDPFAGSGTTLVAAVLEGFDAIGCEMTDEYLPIIDGRVAHARHEAADTPAPAPTLF
jgi:DNA modification methylase